MSKTYLEKILNCLRELKIYSFKINIFVGFFDNNFSDIQKKYKELKIFFYKNSSQNFFWKTLSNSKIFIGAGGTALIEAIYFNVPSIIICRSKNQINNCMNFHKYIHSMSTGSNSINIHKSVYRSSIQYWKNYEKHLNIWQPRKCMKTMHIREKHATT